MKKILYCFCFVALLGLQGCRKASTRDRISITSLRTENVSEVQNNGRSKFLKDKEYSATEIFKQIKSIPQLKYLNGMIRLYSRYLQQMDIMRIKVPVFLSVRMDWLLAIIMYSKGRE